MTSKKQQRGDFSKENYKIVYSTDPQPEKKTSSAAAINLATVKPVITIEKKGRGGKVVTLVSRLPADMKFLEELCVFLKKSAGAGGTFYIAPEPTAGNRKELGIIEIQGERIPQIKKLLEAFLANLQQ